MDMQEMEYPHPQNPTTHGVKIGDGLEFTAHLEEPVFNLLMLNLFDKLIEAVHSNSPDTTSSTDWQNFLSNVETLRKRTQ